MYHSAYDLIVVGAGPGGSIAARVAAEKNLRVLLLEKRQEIGVPVRCAEGIGTKELCEFIEPHPSWISQPINGARLISPNETPVTLNFPEAGYILERKVFDRVLAERAAYAGADVLVKAQVTALLKSASGVVNGVIFSYSGKNYKCRAKAIIAADGIESQVGRWAGIDTTHQLCDVDICAQYLLANIEVKPEFCDFYFGRDIAPRGYVWVFPKGEKIANVGVGIGGAISAGRSGKIAIDYLNDFVKRKFPEASILGQVVGCVPVGGSLPELVADGILLIGDAAHHSDPISGGGIANAMFSGKFAAETVAKAIEVGDVSAEMLRPYQTRWHEEIGKNFVHICRIRDGVLKFSDEFLDRCAETLSKMPNEKIDMAQIFKTVLRHQPKLLLELGHLIVAGWV